MILHKNVMMFYMKKIFYNKLIRDKIPDIIQQKIINFKISTLTKKDYENELFKKLIEEAKEVAAAKNKKELAAELADIEEIIKEIKKVKLISIVDIKKAQKENFKKKGGFKKRLFLHWTEDDGYKKDGRK